MNTKKKKKDVIGKRVKRSDNHSGYNWKKYGFILLGLTLIIISFGMYVQVLPVMFVFVSGLVGLSIGSGVEIMDLILWVLTSVGILVPMIYAYIALVKFIWRFYITDVNRRSKRIK